MNVRLALSGLTPTVYDVVAGLGRARDHQAPWLHGLADDVERGVLQPDRLTFLDMDWGFVERELQRTRQRRRSGPHAENILRDVGVGRPAALEEVGMPFQPVKFYQVGSFVAGNRLLDPTSAPCRPAPSARTR